MISDSFSWQTSGFRAICHDEHRFFGKQKLNEFGTRSSGILFRFFFPLFSFFFRVRSNERYVRQKKKEIIYSRWKCSFWFLERNREGDREGGEEMKIFSKHRETQLVCALLCRAQSNENDFLYDFQSRHAEFDFPPSVFLLSIAKWENFLSLCTPRRAPYVRNIIPLLDSSYSFHAKLFLSRRACYFYFTQFLPAAANPANP